MVRFIEVINNTDFQPRLERTAKVHFSLGEVWINEKFVVSMRCAPAYQKILKEGRLQGDLDGDPEFTAVTINNGNMTEVHVVVGDLDTVARRVNKNTRTLLKG
jgi:hypothetical protein